MGHFRAYVFLWWSNDKKLKKKTKFIYTIVTLFIYSPYD